MVKFTPLFASAAVFVFVVLHMEQARGANFNDDTLSGPPNAQVCQSASKLKAADGTQQANTQTCDSTQLGEIPDESKMTSTIILNPGNGQQIPANKKFNIAIKINNLDTGFFSDPNAQYYAFSQQLNKEGLIKGHSHVVIQQLSNTNSAPDARNFAFFKGLDFAAAGDGTLTQSVDNGLSPGLYRLCTMSSAFSHQSVIMPVAQRGAQDDCIRFSVQ